MPDLPPRADVSELLHRSLVAIEGLGGQWRRALAITAVERLALLHLWEAGPQAMSELAERIPLSRAAMTSLADRLEGLGYIQRVRDPHDRRQIVLQITSLPFSSLAPVTLPYTLDLQSLAGSLTDEDWRAVVGFLNALQEISHRHATRLRVIGQQAEVDMQAQPDAEALDQPHHAGLASDPGQARLL